MNMRAMRNDALLKVKEAYKTFRVLLGCFQDGIGVKCRLLRNQRNVGPHRLQNDLISSRGHGEPCRSPDFGNRQFLGFFLLVTDPSHQIRPPLPHASLIFLAE